MLVIRNPFQSKNTEEHPLPFEIRKENPADYRTVENLTREAFWGCMDHPTCDGEHLVFIQDILIFPTHQRKGVGSALMRAVLDRYRHGRQIKLTSDDTPEAIGFIRPWASSPRLWNSFSYGAT